VQLSTSRASARRVSHSRADPRRKTRTADSGSESAAPTPARTFSDSPRPRRCPPEMNNTRAPGGRKAPLLRGRGLRGSIVTYAGTAEQHRRCAESSRLPAKLEARREDRTGSDKSAAVNRDSTDRRQNATPPAAYAASHSASETNTATTSCVRLCLRLTSALRRATGARRPP